jgi:hypothetical protein
MKTFSTHYKKVIISNFEKKLLLKTLNSFIKMKITIFEKC